MKKLVLETTAPFQGLPELVAYDEGLFEKEGLTIEWADREKGVEKKVEPQVTSPKGVNPFASHGKLFEQGKADMYNACEWGNYCRVQDTGTGSRQLGRRAIVAYAGAGGRARFACLHPAAARQQDDRRAVLFRHPLHRPAHAGRLPAARDDQALPRPERLTLSARRAHARRGRRHHLDRAPHHACREERLPHHLLRPLPWYRGRLGAGGCETYAAFNRAVREAVRRINANKRAYLHYFIDYYAKNDPEVAALEVEDLRESRLVVCNPAPIPVDEMQRTYDWLKSWGMLEETASPLQLVNMDVQSYAHQAAE